MGSDDFVFPSAGQIPVDYTISKGSHLGLNRADLTVYDAHGKLVYRICGRPFSFSPRRIRTLFDSAGNPLISIVHHDDGWQGFRGNSWERKDLVFTAKKISSAQFNTELEVSFRGGNLGDPRSGFRIRGSPFQRSCTIYSENSTVAQTNPLYKLRKLVYSRNKFRLTVFPGTDHALVLAMLAAFFG